MMLQTNTLVFLGAGVAQLGTLEEARKTGYTVVAIDRDANAPGRTFAHHFLQASIHDFAACRDALAALPESVSIITGVVSGSSGRPVEIAAELADFFKIPTFSPAVVSTCNTKAGFSNFCRDAGFQVLEFSLVDLTAGCEPPSMAYPYILKSDKTIYGKTGIFLIQNESDFVRAYTALESANLLSVCMVQDYIEGNDYIIACNAAGGALTGSLVIREVNAFARDGHIRPIGLRLCVKDQQSGLLVPEAQRFLAATGAMQGYVNLSFRKSTQDQAIPIESHFNLAGDLFHEGLFSVAQERSFIQDAIRAACGESTRSVSPLCYEETWLLYFGPDERERVREFLENASLCSEECKPLLTERFVARCAVSLAGSLDAVKADSQALLSILGREDDLGLFLRE